MRRFSSVFHVKPFCRSLPCVLTKHKRRDIKRRIFQAYKACGVLYAKLSLSAKIKGNSSKFEKNHMFIGVFWWFLSDTLLFSLLRPVGLISYNNVTINNNKNDTKAPWKPSVKGRKKSRNSAYTSEYTRRISFFDLD